jgi:glutathione synthase/RimK-type ligase-like ATP-grasp enzyme
LIAFTFTIRTVSSGLLGKCWTRRGPADGQRVVLKTVINDNMVDENESVVDHLSESIIEAGCRVAELIGARLAGIDIITPHIRQGLEEAGGKILKVNTMPGFHYCSNQFAQIKPAVLRTFLTRYEL